MASEDLEYNAQVIYTIFMILLWALCSNFVLFCVSYAQIQRKLSVKTDIKAIKIQSKNFSQF